ncbi:MAG: sigma-70 family RNA polymerase sigma factor [Candidatus Gracilibacteria bacterium]|nr:sigma-70 family RNA polymerase sigma factor [Candidatus Gracilibacteria bacterium]
MDIRSLIQEINRNPDAFGEIIDVYEGKLIRYIMGISGYSYEDAENILQEVFLKVYRHINEYDGQWSFSSWIYRIAHNTTVDEFRKNRKDGGNTSIDDEAYSAIIQSITDGNSPEKDLLKKDIKDCVQRAISHLSGEYREAIMLRCIEGYSYEEISDILRMPTGTVSTLVNRARKQLRTLLEKFHCNQ